MKSLQHLLLTNWHYFSHEYLDFGQINFLTGKTGSGKTTIIDALQLLMIGDTTGHFFNKSASDKSTRSLKGYLRCEFGDNDDGTPLYLRNGRFTSYIAAEFNDDSINQNFVIGIVFDTFEDGSFDWKFFSYDGSIPEDHFIVNDAPLHYKELNERLYSTYKNVEFFQTNIDYREFLKVRLGNLTDSFFQLFKRAIPFAPISNIEQFITEYVCDVENTINIDKMQENFRNYKKLEIETNILVKRVNVLREIVDKYNIWKEKNSSIELKKFIMERSELYLSSKDEEKINLQVAELREDIEENNKEFEKFNKLLSELTKSKEKMIEEKFQSDSFKRKAVYQDKYDQLQQRISEISASVDIVKANILNYIEKWTNGINYFFINTEKDIKDNSELSLLASDTMLKLNKLKEEVENDTVSPDSLNNVSEAMTSFQTSIKKEQFLLIDQNNNLNSRNDELTSEVSALSMGKKYYDNRLIAFKDEVKNHLQAKYQKQIDVDFLSDLIDIKDESWRKAIETYLNTQRFYLVVEPEYVDDAIQIYDKLKNQLPKFDYGIIDTEKVILNDRKPLGNAIAEEITTLNKGAQGFINLLLGNLIKCEDIKELRNAPKSITKDGMLYQNYVARALDFEKTSLFIGSGANSKLIEEKNKEIKDNNVLIENIADTIKECSKINSLDLLNTNEINNISSVYSSLEVLDSLTKEASSAKEMMDSVTDNFLATLESKIQETESQINELTEERDNLKNITLKNQFLIERLLQDELPKCKARVLGIKETMTKEFSKEFTQKVGEPQFLDILKDGKDLMSIYNEYKISIETTMHDIELVWRSLIDQRNRYNVIYEMNYDSHNEDNSDYEKEFENFTQVKLIEYTAKIKEAKENALKEFKNDFLSKLKLNFDTVISQIDSLNDALTYVQFGEDSYRFSVTARPEYKSYFDMINDPLLLTGTDIESKDFMKKYEDTIEDLFRQITFVDSEADKDMRQELEKNIEKFTDYRSYLKFDLIVSNKEGKIQRLSRSLLQKSGGETQTPFYISILASFAQNYRLNMKMDKTSTIRLVIFDEAFSKMDNERIQESIKLLRSFGLQALVCCPSDKIQEITPLADSTICVVRQNTISTVKQFSEIK